MPTPVDTMQTCWRSRPPLGTWGPKPRSGDGGLDGSIRSNRSVSDREGGRLAAGGSRSQFKSHQCVGQVRCSVAPSRLRYFLDWRNPATAPPPPSSSPPPAHTACSSSRDAPTLQRTAARRRVGEHPEASTSGPSDSSFAAETRAPAALPVCSGRASRAVAASELDEP